MEKRLGLGLDSLFGAMINGHVIEYVSLDLISKASWQPRQVFNETELQELASSIAQYGVLQPILLKKIGMRYEIVAGERRFRAAIIVKLEKIPAVIVNFDEKKSLEVGMIENLQRKDLNAIEKAQGFAFLIQQLHLTQEELAKKLGISRSAVANYLRMNDLSAQVKEKIVSGDLSAGHAKLLVNKKNADELANTIVNEKLSVRNLEKKLAPATTGSKDQADFKRFQELISDALCVNVQIESNGKCGKIILNFNSIVQLDELISKLCLV